MSERRVRRRHVIEAMDFLDLVVQRAAHDQPHHQFNAFRAGLAQIFEVRNFHQRLGILGQIVEVRARRLDALAGPKVVAA